MIIIFGPIVVQPNCQTSIPPRPVLSSSLEKSHRLIQLANCSGHRGFPSAWFSRSTGWRCKKCLERIRVWPAHSSCLLLSSLFDAEGRRARTRCLAIELVQWHAHDHVCFMISEVAFETASNAIFSFTKWRIDGSCYTQFQVVEI